MDDQLFLYPYILSDESLKSNIQTLDSVKSLLFILSLETKSFIYNHRQSIGFIAQDVQKVNNDCVISSVLREKGSEKSLLSLCYNDIFVHTTNSIKALAKVVEKQYDSISSLSQRMDDLEKEKEKEKDPKLNDILTLLSQRVDILEHENDIITLLSQKIDSLERENDNPKLTDIITLLSQKIDSLERKNDNHSLVLKHIDPKLNDILARVDILEKENGNHKLVLNHIDPKLNDIITLLSQRVDILEKENGTKIELC
jgi:hypothetical protein